MRWVVYWLALGVSLWGVPALGQSAAKIQPVIGQARKYTVRRGDTLLKIARRENVNIVTLERINALSQRRLRPGMTLQLPSQHILPRDLKEGIVLNVPARQVYVFNAGRLAGTYPAAVGKPGWQTAIGEYHLADKKVNPKWTPTSHIVQAEQIKDDPVPPGKENPLGDRWMGWSKPGYGFHSTNVPRSVGRDVTHGCVRLYPKAAHTMFDQVKVGMPLYSIYEPVLIGERDGQFYLTVFPDIYHKGLVSLAQVQKQLKAVGLLPLVETEKLRAVEQQQDGIPHRIAGTDTRLEIDGKSVELPVALILVGGHWYVPVKPVANALGSNVEAAENNSLKVETGDVTLVLTAGQKSAVLDGKPLALPGEPTVVQGNWIAPLVALTPLFRLHVDTSDKKVLRLQSQTAQAGTPPGP